MSNTTIPDITDIPDRTAVTRGTVNNCNVNMDDAIQSNPTTYNSNKKLSCHMIIDILNVIILNGLTTDCNTTDNLITDPLYQMKNLSFKSIIAKYTLDFKQSVAFEIMASSFIFKSLQIEKVTEDVLHSIFLENEEEIKDTLSVYHD